jgi:hypothetical protein
VGQFTQTKTPVKLNDVSENVDNVLTIRVVELPGNFMVWLSSPEGAFLKGRLVWSNWDVDELMAKKEEITSNPSLLTLGLLGWA